MSRYSLYGPVFDAAKCVSCGLCEKTCRSSCINVKKHAVDYSRCIDCFDCVAICPNAAIGYTRTMRRPVENSHTRNAAVATVGVTRRDALVRGAIAVGATATALTKGNVSLLPVGQGKNSILPAGAVSYANFSQHCTACHLCIDTCPSGVLTPSVLENGITGLFQPHLDYTKAYCAYNCNFCSQVCPAGAIHPISVQEKQQWAIGKAIYYEFHCLINEKGIECGNCARHCPKEAITMIEKGNTLIPKVNHKQCIGCGACEYYCPASPKAITVRPMNEQKRLGEAGMFRRGNLS
ncbi:MAG: 4Fe-4S binding protein [Megasphaera sp.]|nr:4Fe-4S binding protein [Megasphaera sp.]MCH4187606.1 4Fe-4S binding protein [Megasphaera sp.]MCH4217849.1 4Fe-4S binding protein [Megasphaera sp.]